MRVTPEGLEKLAAYDWPGNLRELANVLERATILSRVGAGRRRRSTCPSARPGRRRPVEAPPLREGAVHTLEEVQRQHIARVLALTRGRIYGPGGAAALLGLKPSTLQSRMKKLGITRLEQYVAATPPASGK